MRPVDNRRSSNPANPDRRISKKRQLEIAEEDRESNPIDFLTLASPNTDPCIVREEECENLTSTSLALIDVTDASNDETRTSPAPIDVTDASNDEHDKSNLLEGTATSSNAIDEALEAAAPMLLFDEEVNVTSLNCIFYILFPCSSLRSTSEHKLAA